MAGNTENTFAQLNLNLLQKKQTFYNLLPFDAEVFYFGKILSQPEADYYFDKLFREISWQEERLRIAGREVVAKRKVAWYGDKAYEYKYSGTSKTALPFTAALQELRDRISDLCHSEYNSCLLNYYPNGESAMAWHADNETSLVTKSSIASLSLGAERKFCFKHKLKQTKISLLLEHGSLLEMKGETQMHWLHSLPASARVKLARINLTFRRMV